MKFVSVMYALSAQCPSCRKPVPINGASQSVLCDSCQTPMKTGEALFRMIADTAAEVVELPEGEGSNSSMFGSYKLSLTYGRLQARCEPTCKTPYPEDALTDTLANGGGEIHCSECGKKTSVRPPPDWFKDTVHKSIVGLVSESLSVESAAQKTDPKDVRFHCYHCGAAMGLDGNKRTVHCDYCSADMMVPDDIWVRLHPAPTVQRWFALIDMQGAVGIVPEDCRAFCDFTVDPSGNMVLAWRAEGDGEVGHPCRIAVTLSSGLLRWVQDGVEFSRDTTLHVSRNDASIAIIEEKEGFIRYLDAATGQPIRTLTRREHDNNFVDVKEHRGIAIDWDGSIILRRHWEDSREDALRRFSPTGERMPLWPGAKLKQKERDRTATWERLGNEANQFPDGSLFTVGWDGGFYVLDKKATHVAKFDRSGKLFGVMETGLSTVARVRAFDVSREGVIHVLYTHSEKIGDDDYSHVMRIHPRGRCENWLGPHVEGSPLIGEYDNKLELMPDGRVYIGNGLSSLRIIGPDRTVLWKSAKTERNEERLLEQIAKGRRGKKLAGDLFT